MLNHELRSKGIGGSEIAAVAGISPWAGAVDVWQKKMGLHKEPDNVNMERGRFLEAALREWYADQEGRIVFPADTMRHKEHPIVIATPDGLSWREDAGGPDAVLEVKAPQRTQHHWGTPGTDEIPKYYLPQVIWEMAVTGLDTAHVAAMVYGELRVYYVPWNPGLFTSLLEIAQDFWDNHILTETPPPPDASKGYSEFLKRQHPTSTDVILPATVEADGLAHQLKDAEGLHKLSEERCEMLKNKMRGLIGDNAGIEGPWGRITWKRSKDGTKTNWKEVAERAGASQEDIDASSIVKSGSRRFLTNWS